MADTQFTYWGSDPKSLDVAQHHYRVPSDVDLHDVNGNLPYHLHDTAPDPSLKDAIWDDNANGWVENDGKQQVQVIYNAQQDLDQKVTALKQTADQLTQDKDSLQKDLQNQAKGQQQSNTQTLVLTRTLTNLSTKLDNYNKLMIGMQKIMMSTSQKVDALSANQSSQPTQVTQPSAPKQDEQTTQTTTAQNGGNN